MSACFLSRPPQFQQLQRQQGPAGLSAESELVVDCSEQMLQQILKENPAIKRAHEALVETGKAHLLLLRGTGIVVLLLPLHAVLRLRGLLLLTLTLLLLDRKSVV